MPRGIARNINKLWRSKRYFTQAIPTQDPHEADMSGMLEKCDSCGRLRMYHPLIARLPMVFPDVGTACAFKWVDSQ